MNYLLEWQQPSLLYWLVPVYIAAVLYRAYYYRPVCYRYSLAQEIANDHKQASHVSQYLLFAMRALNVGVIMLLCAMPRLVDIDSRIPVEGIDIMLVLDISGSMQQQDDPHDERTRLDVAKQEAIRFIEKRTNDAIGLVLFANDALSRVPLTMDKKLLKQVIGDIELGFINPNGTLLFTGMITAANRLKHAQAKSKVMILLTDGEPTEGDMSPHIALEIVQALGIRVYTIGIGSDQTRYITHPLGLIPVPGVNKELLLRIAQETGGQFFLARNPQDMRLIYDKINALETSAQEVPLYGKWYDLIFSAIWAIIAILCMELLCATFIWFSL